MNEIIRKVVDQLSKETPDISYIRGMLETVLSMSDVPNTYHQPSAITPLFVGNSGFQKETQVMDEASVLDHLAAAALPNLPKPIAE